MHFELYTEKTVKQCMTAINERLQEKEGRSRMNLDGWIEKGGRFSLAVTTPVILRFIRTTRLRAMAERDGNITVVRGYVPSGADQRQIRIIFIALLAVAVLLLLNSEAILGLFVVGIGAALYIPLHGDYENSSALLKELRRILSAKDTPPKNR